LGFRNSTVSGIRYRFHRPGGGRDPFWPADYTASGAAFAARRISVSDAAAYVTGTEIFVNGGQHVYQVDGSRAKYGISLPTSSQRAKTLN
jgi:hypothetical protein